MPRVIGLRHPKRLTEIEIPECQMCGKSHWVNPEARDEDNVLHVECGSMVILNRWIEADCHMGDN